MAASHQSAVSSDRQALALLVSRVGTALFVVYVAALAAAALPIRLLDPGWQWRMVNTLINQAFLPLIGLTLLWLASSLDPGQGRLKARRDRLAGLAVAVAVGFLLLIPVQAVALVRGLQTIRQADQLQLRQARAQIAQVRQAVLETTTVAELQQRLQQLRVPALRRIDGSRSLNSLRPQLLGAIATAETTLNQPRQAVPADRLWTLMQDSLRVTVSCLAYAIAFAACARRPGRRTSELDDWLLRWRRRKPAQRRQSSWRSSP